MLQPNMPPRFLIIWKSQVFLYLLTTEKSSDCVKSLKRWKITGKKIHLPLHRYAGKTGKNRNIATRRIAFTREEEEQIKQVLDDPQYKLKNKAEIKVVFYIGMYTGQRLKDCVLMQWQNVDLEQRRIFVKQFKTGKEVSIPLAEPLRQLLSEVKDQNLSSTYISPNVAMRYKQKDARGKAWMLILTR